MDQQILSSRAIMGMYYQRLDVNPGLPWVNGISSMYSSDQESETYGWLGMTPALREWVGGRHAKNLRSNAWAIANKPYEATIELAKKDVRRDKTGQVRARINDLADRSVTHWASLLSALLLAAPTTVCYDGQYFFDTDHAEGASGTQDNALSIDISALPCAVHGSTTIPSVEEMQQCILRAITAIMSFKDDQGEPMNENAMEFNVQVAPSLYLIALAAVNTLNLAVISQNLVQGLPPGLKVVPSMNARLASWTASFAVFRTDGSVKPLIRQQDTTADQPGELKAKAEGSEYEFDNNAWQFGIDTIRGAGYGQWQQSCHVTMT